MRKHPPQRRGGSLVAKGKAAGGAPARRSRLKRELRKKASAEAERAANGPVQTRSSHVLRTRKERTNAPFDSREGTDHIDLRLTPIANPVSSPNFFPC